MKLSLTALLVRDYDEAIDWYTEVLGFRLVTDDDQGGGKRWVVIEDEAGGGCCWPRPGSLKNWQRSATSMAAASATFWKPGISIKRSNA